MPPLAKDGADRLAVSRLVRPSTGTGSNSEVSPRAGLVVQGFEISGLGLTVDKGYHANVHR